MKVSIIIPIYNVEKFLQDCILSVFNQTYKDVEIIFIEDCSTDNSKSILYNTIEKLNIDRNKFKIIEHQNNLGLAKSRIDGLLHSSGNYIYHLDSDDWIDPNTISQLVKNAQINNSDLVFSKMKFCFPNKEITRCDENLKSNNKNKIIKEILLRNYNYPWNLVNILIRRDIALKELPYEDINMGEDWVTVPRLIYIAKKISYNNHITYYYRQNNNFSYTNNISKQSISELIAASQKLENYFKNSSFYLNDKFYYLFRNKLKFSIYKMCEDDMRRFLNHKLKSNNIYNGLKINEIFLAILEKYKLWKLMNFYISLGLLFKSKLKYFKK